MIEILKAILMLCMIVGIHFDDINLITYCGILLIYTTLEHKEK